MQHGRVPPELPSHISELMIINGVDLPASFLSCSTSPASPRSAAIRIACAKLKARVIVGVFHIVRSGVVHSRVGRFRAETRNLASQLRHSLKPPAREVSRLEHHALNNGNMRSHRRVHRNRRSRPRPTYLQKICICERDPQVPQRSSAFPFFSSPPTPTSPQASSAIHRTQPSPSVATLGT